LEGGFKGTFGLNSMLRWIVVHAPKFMKLMKESLDLPFFLQPLLSLDTSLGYVEPLGHSMGRGAHMSPCKRYHS